MKIFVAIIIGLIGGFILGVALSSFIGILGMTVLSQPLGIKYLPYITAFICAIVLPVLEYKKQVKQ